MNLSLLFPAYALLCGSYILLSLRNAQSYAAHHRLRGLQAVMHLRRLLEALPQHRGMANALLQGDESFRSKLMDLQAQINRNMSKMDTLLLSAGDSLDAAERSQSILKGWSTITERLNLITAPESFGRHTALITELLYLINDVADAAGLLTDTDSNAQLIDVAINTLPQVTETLGQARGMGTGVAAIGKCDTDMRVKLRYLLGNTQQVADEVGLAVRGALSEQTAGGTYHDTGFAQRARNTLDDSQQATRQFLSLLDTGIIHENTVEVAPADFYDAGTVAIQQSFSLLDIILTSLNHHLSQAAQLASRRVWLSRGLAAGLMLPAVYLLRGLFA